MSDNSGFSAQPVTGTAVGYRWWDLFLNGARPRQVDPPSRPVLCGAWASWLQGTNKAVCLAPGIQFSTSIFSVSSGMTLDPVYSDSHNAPGSSCRCGYWAFWDKPFYWRTAPDINSITVNTGIVPVMGVAEGWGRTLKGSLGFRCEYAKVTALLAPPAYKDLLSQLQPQAMIYTSARAMFGEHPAGIMGNKTE